MDAGGGAGGDGAGEAEATERARPAERTHGLEYRDQGSYEVLKRSVKTDVEVASHFSSSVGQRGAAQGKI